MLHKKRFTRRKFLRSLCLFSAFLCSGCSFDFMRRLKKSVHGANGNQLTDAEFIRQIVTADPSTSRTIMWQSAAKQDDCHINIRKTGQKKITSISGTTEPFTDDGQQAFLHTVRLAGLTPQTNYEYQLQNKTAATDWFPLSTGNTDTFKALIFPDSQCSDYSVWQKNARTAFKNHPDCSFFINMGDLVDNGEDHHQWEAWFDAVDENIRQIPFAPVMGNHETYNKNWKVRSPQAYLQEFAVPGNNSQTFDRYYYSFDWGDAHFVVLNTQHDELKELTDEDLIAEQIAWLRHDCTASSKKWRIALLHKDILRYAIRTRPERIQGISDIGHIYAPIFEELGFDLVLTAHLHTYRNRGCLSNFVPDSNGPLYILTGVAGNIFYNNFWLDHKLDKVKAPQPETGNCLTLTVNSNQLKLESFLFDGTKFDEIILNQKYR